MKYSDALSVFKKQLIRSVTSMAVNYRAGCTVRSEIEKYAKQYIVVDERDECDNPFCPKKSSEGEEQWMVDKNGKIFENHLVSRYTKD